MSNKTPNTKSTTIAKSTTITSPTTTNPRTVKVDVEGVLKAIETLQRYVYRDDLSEDTRLSVERLLKKLKLSQMEHADVREFKHMCATEIQTADRKLSTIWLGANAF